MGQTKIVKMLRLMKLLTGNVSRAVDRPVAELGIFRNSLLRFIIVIPGG